MSGHFWEGLRRFYNFLVPHSLFPWLTASTLFNVPEGANASPNLGRSLWWGGLVAQALQEQQQIRAVTIFLDAGEGHFCARQPFFRIRQEGVERLNAPAAALG